jgi:CDP-glycerol glycerophosphotransferase (TagB/SpsB family)
MFLFVANKSRQVRPVWLTASRQLAAVLRLRGYEAHYVVSRMGAWCLLRAGCILTDEGIGPIRRMLVGRTKVDLWHGVGPKKLAESTGADYVCGTSESLRQHLAGSLGVNPDKVIVSGYPRNDVLLQSVPGEDIGLQAHLEAVRVLRNQGRILLYAPTYRRYLEEGTFEEFLKEIPIDATELDKVLEAHRSYLIIKFHQFLRSGRIEHALEKISGRVYVIGEPIDVYPIMRDAEVLITDYSSIYFDYLLLDRPIIFYIPDHERYLRRTRGFALDFDTFTPGHKAANFAELAKALDSVLRGEDIFKTERKRVREYAFDSADASSSDRLYAWLMRLLDLPMV